MSHTLATAYLDGKLKAMKEDKCDTEERIQSLQTNLTNALGYLENLNADIKEIEHAITLLKDL